MTRGTKRKAPDEGDDEDDEGDDVERPWPDGIVQGSDEDSAAQQIFLVEVAEITASFNITLKNLEYKVTHQEERRASYRNNLREAVVRHLESAQLRQHQREIEQGYQWLKDQCNDISRCVELATVSQNAKAQSETSSEGTPQSETSSEAAPLQSEIMSSEATGRQSEIMDAPLQSVISEVTGQSEIHEATGQNEILDAPISQSVSTSEATGQNEIPDSLSANTANATAKREISKASAELILKKIEDYLSETKIEIEALQEQLKLRFRRVIKGDWDWHPPQSQTNN